MVALESMACGTPVVAFANGALREMIDSGVTGYLAQEEQDFPLLVEKALTLDRIAIRKYVESRFHVAQVLAPDGFVPFLQSSTKSATHSEKAPRRTSTFRL